jgi:hypothetical protein
MSQAVRGSVVAEVGGTPIFQATVTARGGGSAITDRWGRFSVWVAGAQDTLVVTAIGWEPATLLIESDTGEHIVRMRRAPLVLSELIVTSGPRSVPAATSPRGWRMPMQAARAVPAAIEPDIYRALALVPAISFTSPLSARPLLRGYDAQEVATRIDGFEVANLYHLARIFSAYPADAASAVVVTPSPGGASDGAIAGTIDIEGRTGPARGTVGGAGFSFGSLSGYIGGGDSGIRYFGAGRFFHLGALDLVPGVEVPYRFADLYGSVTLGPPARANARVSLFATADRVGDRASDRHLDWDNVLIAGRWQVVSRPTHQLDLTASGTSYRQVGVDVPGLRTVGTADLANRFGRAAWGAELTLLRPHSRVIAGLTVGWRRVENRIAETRPGSSGSPELPVAATDLGRLEIAAVASASRRLGSLVLEGGVRVDQAGGMIRAQPRLDGRWRLAPRVELALAAGRTARLYQLLGEARSEPDFDFLDFWLTAGDGIPAAQVDHGTLDLIVEASPLSARISGYLSSGSGIGEVRPASDQVERRFEFFRFGRSRTRGGEVQIGYRGQSPAAGSASLSYAYARSERHWGEGWLRWAQDRRHQLRGIGQVQVGRLAASALLEAATGMPATAVVYRHDRDLPGFPVADPFGAFPTFGGENAVETSGTFRVDAALQWMGGRPGGTQVQLGVAVINLFQTEVAPIGLGVGTGREASDRTGRPTEFRRLFRLPAVPTITLRVELQGRGQ